MLVAFTFAAKKGKEAEFEALLSNPEGGRAVARGLGATRNTLFLKGGRMVRVFEFPDGAKPPSINDLAGRDSAVRAFLAELGPLVEGGFDVDQPGSLEAFNQRVMLSLAYDVRP